MTVLALGDFSDSRPYAARCVIEQAVGGSAFVHGQDELLELLERTSTRCVIVGSAAQARDASRVIGQAKGRGGVPLLVLVDQVSPRQLSELHAAGVDDVILLSDIVGLERRLASIPNLEASQRPTLFKGTCLLAHADPLRRQLFSRVLEQAGFAVKCASTMTEALVAAGSCRPVALVVSNTLPPEGGRRTLRTLAERGYGSVPCVLLASGSPAAFSPQGWAIVAEEAPPDDLLFVVNDLLRPRELVEARSSRRILYATLCDFRAAGERAGRPGLTYNISRAGLFVRTLDAPAAGSELWLELTPPGETAMVHLRGKVAWTMPLSGASRGATPVGFGVQLLGTSSPPPDLQTYVDRYEWMLRIATSVGT